MLIELTHARGPRIHITRFPHSLIVAVVNGGVRLKRHPTVMSGLHTLDSPEYKSRVEGVPVDAYRLSPRRQGSDWKPSFTDPGETGWEYTVNCRDQSTTEHIMITLVHEENDGEEGWVAWLHHIATASASRVTLTLPDFDPLDKDPIILNELLQIPTDRPPTAWDRISGDDD